MRLISKIHNFIELDYPLIIGCIDTVVKENKHMQIRNLEYLYVQGDKVCAELSSQVQIMSNRIYNIFRVKDRKMLTKKRALITNLDLLNR